MRKTIQKRWELGKGKRWGDDELNRVPQNDVEVREVVVPSLQNRGVSGYTGMSLTSPMITKNENIQAMFTISFTSPDCTFV